MSISLQRAWETVQSGPICHPHSPLHTILTAGRGVTSVRAPSPSAQDVMCRDQHEGDKSVMLSPQLAHNRISGTLHSGNISIEKEMLGFFFSFSGKKSLISKVVDSEGEESESTLIF